MKKRISFLSPFLVLTTYVHHVTSFSSNNPLFLSSTIYLNSLPTTPIADQEGSTTAASNIPVPAETTTKRFIPNSSNSASNAHLEEVANNTPAKDHPGAVPVWAAYKNPSSGGYLDNLNENTFDGKVDDYGDDNRWNAQEVVDTNRLDEPIVPTSTENKNKPSQTFGGSYLDSLNGNVFEEGKVADYGDDIRWGAQVYLDRLDEPIATSPSEEINGISNANEHLEEVAMSTPDEHYAKKNPGAGWAGYKNPMFGGYLDNLSEGAFE